MRILGSLSSVILGMALVGCSADAPNPEPTEAPADDLVTLLMMQSHARMVDCGNDEPVGDLACAYLVDGTERPTPDTSTIRSGARFSSKMPDNRPIMQRIFLSTNDGCAAKPPPRR